MKGYSASLGRLYGTSVKHPVSIRGYRYVPCCYCGLLYTAFGVSRHWDKCFKKPKAKSKEAANVDDNT